MAIVVLFHYSFISILPPLIIRRLQGDTKKLHGIPGILAVMDVVGGHQQFAAEAIGLPLAAAEGGRFRFCGLISDSEAGKRRFQISPLPKGLASHDRPGVHEQMAKLMGDSQPITTDAIGGALVDILPDEHEFLVRKGDTVVVAHNLPFEDVIDKRLVDQVIGLHILDDGEVGLCYSP